MRSWWRSCERSPRQEVADLAFTRAATADARASSARCGANGNAERSCGPSCVRLSPGAERWMRLSDEQLLFWRAEYPRSDRPLAVTASQKLCQNPYSWTKPRRRPGKLHADKGYDYDHLRRWLRGRGIRRRVARRGIESSQRLGRHRWVVERTVSGWPAADASTAATNAPEHFLAFVGIAATLICHRRLAKKRTLNPTKTATRGAA